MGYTVPRGLSPELTREICVHALQQTRSGRRWLARYESLRSNGWSARWMDWRWLLRKA